MANFNNNGLLTVERSTTPDERHEREEMDFDYENFSGSYGSKRIVLKDEVKPRLYASVVIPAPKRITSKRLATIRRMAQNDAAVDSLFGEVA